MDDLPDERPKQLPPPFSGRDVKTRGPMPGCGIHSRPKLAQNLDITVYSK